METEMVSQLIDQFGMDVMRFCRKLTFCSEDAQDLYQQTFLKLMELRVAIRKEENPRAFLFSIANGIWKMNAESSGAGQGLRRASASRGCRRKTSRYRTAPIHSHRCSSRCSRRN